MKEPKNFLLGAIIVACIGFLVNKVGGSLSPTENAMTVKLDSETIRLLQDNQKHELIIVMEEKEFKVKPNPEGKIKIKVIDEDNIQAQLKVVDEEGEEIKNEQIIIAKNNPKYSNKPVYSDIPPFPLPPPQASATTVIDDRYFDDSKSLFDAKNKIERTLKACGYYEKSYYRVENGFAIVTRIEKITETIEPYKEPERWKFDHKIDEKPFSLKEYLHALFFADEGKYRIIVFVITDIPFHQSQDVMTVKEAENYLKAGSNILPTEFKDYPYTDSHSCTALVYEFNVPDRGGSYLVKTSNYLGQDHLTKNNFLQTLFEK